MAIIEIERLTKKYGSVSAVDGISFSIKEGEIFGFLGPNGAGKTTTISMLSTINEPTSGTARVNGYDIVRQKNEVRSSIGIVFQDPSLDDQLTGRENLELHGMLYGVPATERRKAIDRALELVDLGDKADAIVKAYSGGMRRRLELARGLVHRHKVLFLDEPTVGLDPQTRRKIWAHIKHLNEKQRITIILTTHYIEEADALCSRIGVIDHGKMIRIDTSEKLKDSLGGDIITANVSSPKEFIRIAKRMRSVKSAKDYDDGKVDITAGNGSMAIPALLKAAYDNKIRVDSITLKRPSLEDVFIALTGREIRDETGDNMTTMRMRFRGR